MSVTATFSPLEVQSPHELSGPGRQRRQAAEELCDLYRTLLPMKLLEHINDHPVTRRCPEFLFDFIILKRASVHELAGQALS